MSWAGGYGPRLTGFLDSSCFFEGPGQISQHKLRASGEGCRNRRRARIGLRLWRKTGGGVRVRALPGDFRLSQTLHSIAGHAAGNRGPYASSPKGVGAFVLIYRGESSDASAAYYLHAYARPCTDGEYPPRISEKTMCVAPSPAARSVASFLAFCIPTDAATLPKPEDPWTLPRKRQSATIFSSASWTALAELLKVVAHPESSNAAEKITNLMRAPLLCPGSLFLLSRVALQR